MYVSTCSWLRCCSISLRLSVCRAYTWRAWSVCKACSFENGRVNKTNGNKKEKKKKLKTRFR